MTAIRNSMIGQCLKVLLIGYFLVNSLNLASSLDHVLVDGRESVYEDHGMFCSALKLFFDCEESIEEYEFDKQETKNAKKGVMAFDYLIPGCNWASPTQSRLFYKSRVRLTDFDRKGGLYAKIHLPPPERRL